MLLDIGTVLGGIGLAVVAFLVVCLVCVEILRLLAAILPSYEDRDAVAAARKELKARADAEGSEELADADADTATEVSVSGPEEIGGTAQSPD
jgi:hypothetical protein